MHDIASATLQRNPSPLRCSLEQLGTTIYVDALLHPVKITRKTSLHVFTKHRSRPHEPAAWRGGPGAPAQGQHCEPYDMLASGCIWPSA